MRIILLNVLFFAARVAAGTPVAFVNVNVLPMTGEELLPAQTVVVEGERIAVIGAVGDTAIPDGAMIVDGTDRYLMPGLTEMHGHVTGTGDAEIRRLFGLYLANGVTTVRGMLGRAAHLRLRASILRHEVVGPRLITSSPSINGNSVTSPAQAERMVREFHAAGYDFLKIHPGLTRGEFDAMAATANELGIPFAGHVPTAVGVHAALAAGMATIDHLDGYMQALVPPVLETPADDAGFFGLMLAGAAEEPRIVGLANATQQAGTWNVPTQTLYEHTVDSTPTDTIADWPEMKYVARQTLDGWVRDKTDLLSDDAFDRTVADRSIELRRALILTLHESGAGLLLGSDSPQRFNVPGFALHRELGLMVASGLTPLEALRTGTVNPARFFGAAEERGTVETGRTADLVLLDDNPLQDIANSRRVHGTMVRGRWLPRTELDRMLRFAEAR